MAESLIRVGVVGLGLMGRWHLANIARANGEVVALIDVNEHSLSSLGAQYPRANRFGDLAEALRVTKPDVIHICTPPSSHEQMAALSLTAGVNVIVEKPMADSAACTATLFDKAERAGKLLCAVHQFPFQDGVIDAKQSLPAIGRVVHIDVSICSAGAGNLTGEAATAVALDILPHPMSLIEAIFPSRFRDFEWSVLAARSGELRVRAQSSDLTIAVLISMHARPPECSMKISGTEGAIQLDLFHGYSYVEGGRVSRFQKAARPLTKSVGLFAAASGNLARRVWRRETAYPGLRRLMESFYKAVQTGGPCPVSREQVVAAARLREMVTCAAEPALARIADPNVLHLERLIGIVR